MSPVIVLWPPSLITIKGRGNFQTASARGGGVPPAEAVPGVPQEKSRDTLQRAALACARMFLEADLGWLQGFPTALRPIGRDPLAHFFGG